MQKILDYPVKKPKKKIEKPRKKINSNQSQNHFETQHRKKKHKNS